MQTFNAPLRKSLRDESMISQHMIRNTILILPNNVPQGELQNSGQVSCRLGSVQNSLTAPPGMYLLYSE